MARDCLSEDAACSALLRRERDERTTLVSALAAGYVRGADVDWSASLNLAGGMLTDLPTYPFQRQRFWVETTAQPVTAERLGVRSAAHPLLGVVVELVESGGVVVTGWLSVGEVAWLVDHVVLGVVVVPGAALVEWVLWAGAEVGCSVVEELVVEQALVVPVVGGVRVQVVVGGVDGVGRRAVSVFSDDGGGWVRRVSGFVSGHGVGGVDVGWAEQWPPVGAVSVSVGGFYERQFEAGYEYGPVFQGLTGVWRRGEELFAEVVLPQGVGGGEFGVHPALLDAALQASSFLGLGAESEDGGLLLPFVWGGVRLWAVGALGLRVRLVRVGDRGVSLVGVDGGGGLVVSVESLVFRGVRREVLTAGVPAGDGLWRVVWSPVGGGSVVPVGGGSVVGLPVGGGPVVPVGGGLVWLVDGGGVPGPVGLRRVLDVVLARVQEVLAGPPVDGPVVDGPVVDGPGWMGRWWW